MRSEPLVLPEYGMSAIPVAKRGEPKASPPKCSNGHQLPMEDNRPVRVSNVSNNGKAVTLEDGSVWEIFFVDSIKSSIWIPVVTRVNVRVKHGVPYPYTTVLEKAGSGQKVRAKRIK